MLNDIRLIKARSLVFSLFAFWLLISIAACERQVKQLELNGFTMGTSYQIKLKQLQANVDKAELQKAIDQQLLQLNKTFSHYDQNSELSQLNRQPPGQPLMISEGLYQVLAIAQTIHQQSSGAFDISIAPLVELWGFGTKKNLQPDLPEQRRIQQALKNIGLSKLQLSIRQTEKGTQAQALKLANIQLDLSAIAKGYAVDRIADFLEARGFKHYMVEIGGEIRLAYQSGAAWRIGIETPESGLQRSASKALSLKNTALATSGDYRNFFEHQGQRYSHTIDPRTGWPVKHHLVSVTVLHPQCVMADAYATALSVLGVEQAQALANQLNLAVYFMIEGEQGFKVITSEAFERFNQ